MDCFVWLRSCRSLCGYRKAEKERRVEKDSKVEKDSRVEKDGQNRKKTARIKSPKFDLKVKSE